MAQPCSSLERVSYTHRGQTRFAPIGSVLSLFSQVGAAGMGLRSRNPRSARELRLVTLASIVSEKARHGERVSVKWAVFAGGHLVFALGGAPLSN